MGRLGRKIFGMSKEDYVQKYGAKVCNRNKVNLFLIFINFETLLRT